jgi:hypothetical protein
MARFLAARVSILALELLVPLMWSARSGKRSADLYNSRNLRKTGFFAIHDQVKETQPDWGDGASGFAKRVGSLQAGNIIQNSFGRLGQCGGRIRARYDRCRCEEAWLRIRHAVVRNFITYGGSADQGIRSQIMSYAAAFGAGVTVGS